MASSDREHITAAQHGDRAALESLFSLYLTSVYRFVYRIVGNATDADDTTQETFVKAWRALGKFDVEKNFLPWVLRIAKHTALDFMKKKNPVAFSTLTVPEENALRDAIIDHEPLPDALIDTEFTRAQVQEFVQTLPIPQQTVLFLHYQEQLTFQEIADILEESIDTVKTRHRRAVMQLRRGISE